MRRIQFSIRRRLVTGAVALLCGVLALGAAPFPQFVGDLDGDGVATVIDLVLLNNYLKGVTPIPDATFPLRPFLDVNQDGFVNSDDSTALIQRILGVQSLQTVPLTHVREMSPFAGESGVSLMREVILRFTTPLSLSTTLDTTQFHADAGGRRLLARVELSSDHTKATLFFLETVPGSTRVTVTFDGTGVKDLLERPLDADNNGLSGGTLVYTYDSAPITGVAGTGIIGHVYASEKASGGGDTPLPGALVRVVGSETLFTYTAADGSFSLNPCPTGRFFVEVDGRTCPVSHFPDGGYYPYIVKAWEAQPGRTNNLAAGTGTIYLPLVPAATLQPVSATTTTTVAFAPSVVAANPALAGVEIYVPPNSLFADDGTRGGKVGLAPVASDRLPEPLPPGLNHALDISIQTDGATNFDRPVPVKFPNLPDPVTGIKLKPGEKSALWSYNHDKGAWEIAGPMTVTDDGNFLITDVGVGVRQPGWHGANPGAQGDGAAPGPPCNPARPGSDGGGGCPEEDCGLFDYGFIGPAFRVWKDFQDLANEAKAGLGFAFGTIESVFSAIKGAGKVAKLPGTIDNFRKHLDEYKNANAKNQACIDCPNLPPNPPTACGPNDQGPNAPPPLPQAIKGLSDAIGAAQRQSAVAGSSATLAGDAAQKLVDLSSRIDPDQFHLGLPEVDYQDAVRELEVIRDNINQIQELVDKSLLVIQFTEVVTGSVANTYIGTYTKSSQYILIESEDGDNPFTLRIRSSANGNFTANFAPNTLYLIRAFDPSSGKAGGVLFRAPSNGERKVIPAIPLVAQTGLDTDSDGLTDYAEEIIGTDITKRDSDGDGIDDLSEIQNNTNPLDNRVVLSGVVNSIDTPGQAKDIAAQNTVAVLADGSEGVSVFNVANALNPVRTVQVRFTGSTEAVALDGTLAAATGSSLSLLDLSDLSAVRVTKQLVLGGTPRAVTAAGGVAYTGLDNGQVVAVDMAAGAELERLQVSTEPIHDLSFAGDVLYARSASRVYALEFAPAGMTVASSVAVPGSSAARQRLFAGVGVIYAPKEDGYTILSLTDPLHPAVAQTITVAQRGWRQFVPTGSGLGLGIFTNFAAADLHLYNIGANGAGSQFLTTFTTPGDSQAVSIFNGLAYVADGDAGLTVVNYKAYDALGVPPTISISTGFPAVNGAVQAEEGKMGRITAAVADDVQVRDVEFYVDGQLIVTDGNFPFEHRFTTPLLATGKTSFTLRAKATDTGGNSTSSATLTVNLVKDATPPRVVKFLPPTGSFTGSLSTLAVTFSEPIDQATLTAASLAVTGAGPDGVFGTADDLVPAGGAISYRAASNAAFIVFPQSLTPSLYRLVVNAPIADLAGNQLAASAQTQFRVFSFTDSDGDGIPDDVEPLLGLDPHNPDTDGNGVRDGDEDYDHDHLTNAQEIALGLDPRNAYSNGTSTLDGDADPDHDGLSNRREAIAGTNPNKADTDGDGWNDEAEVTGGSNPLDPKSRPIGLVTSVPTTNVVRLGDMTSGLFAAGSIAAQPTIFVARTVSDPNTQNGGLGSAAFVATPTLFIARQVSLTSDSSGIGSAAFIASPTVNIFRLDLTGTFIAVPPVTVTTPSP